jgi:hypothetical protein
MHQSNITDLPLFNRNLTNLTNVIQNKTATRQELLEKQDIIKAEDIDNRVTKIENQIVKIERIEYRYYLQRNILNEL